jgi:hypothetical protein
MALRGGQHAGRFAIGFAELAIGGARDQATLGSVPVEGEMTP